MSNQNAVFAVLYSTVTGKIIGSGDADKGNAFSDRPLDTDVLWLEAVVEIDVATQSVNLTTNTLCNVAIVPPTVLPKAGWEIIKVYRDQFENAPISTANGLLDVDSISLERLGFAIDNFAVLNKNADNKLGWKMADNVVANFTLPELTTMYEQAKIAKAQRTNLLHTVAENFRQATQKPTIAYISDIANWQ